MFMTENHLRFVTDRHIRVKVSSTFTSVMYTFTKLHDRHIPMSRVDLWAR